MKKTAFAGYISWLCFGWNLVWGTYDLKSVEQNKWKNVYIFFAVKINF